MESRHAGCPALSLLHGILEDLKKPQAIDANVETIRELLSREDFVDVAADINNASDARDLLDFMLRLLCDGHLSNSGIQSEASRARRLMLKIATKTPVIPRSLFVTGVTGLDHFDYIGYGGFGVVIKGELRGAVVALKLLYTNAHHNSIEFCREALTWRSLNHKFVLPLLGIYEDRSSLRLFLVSPYMENGTLTHWRKKASPSTDEIEKRILEVAQGIQYIHSEGVVHGQHSSGYPLTCANLRLWINPSFGGYRYKVGSITSHNFAAPELFGDWDAEDDSDDGRSMARTHESDIYAFGCLYYEIHYDAVPFAGAKAIQIIKSVSRGQRPPRLQVPYLSDEAWKLMQDCWSKDKSTRPAIEDIVERVMSWQTSRALRVIENLKGLCKPESVDDILSWTSMDPRESQLFNSWGILYRFQTNVNATEGLVTTLWRMIRPVKEDRVAKLVWAANGGLGRARIGKNLLPMSDMTRPDPFIKAARVFNGPDGLVYRWRPSGTNSDILLQDANGDVIAFFRPTRGTRYPIGDVYGELHFLRNAGAGTVMHPPMMDTVTVTAMLYRFCDAWNL